MRNSGNVVFGGVILALGILWLLKSLDVYTFYWSDILDLWYWFLIAAGVLLLISGFTGNRVASSLSGILITLAIVGGVTQGAHRGFRELAPFEWNARKWKERKNHRESRAGERVKGDFGYDMQPGLKSSKLNFSGGAGVFTIEGSTERLFQARTASSFVNYISNIRHNTADNFATVDFKMEEADLNLDDDNSDNTVNVQLNDSVKWDIDLKFGAGEGKFDLSNYVVEKLQMNAGAADVRLKLGNRSSHSEIDIKAGVASVEVQVPKNAAVEINATGALISTEFPGFEKAGKDKYRSSGYSESENRITISYKGGLSSLKIEQY